MEDSFSMLNRAIWSGLSGAGIVFMWLWSLAGWRHLSHSSYTDVIRGRNIAVSSSMLLLLVLTLLSLEVSPVLPPWLTALSSAGAFVLHCAIDPSKEGFWHHQRLRWIGTVTAIGTGLALAILTSKPVMMPLIFAAAVFHRHHLGGVRLTSQCLDDLEQLKSKILTLEASRSLETRKSA